MLELDELGLRSAVNVFDNHFAPELGALVSGKDLGAEVIPVVFGRRLLEVVLDHEFPDSGSQLRLLVETGGQFLWPSILAQRDEVDFFDCADHAGVDFIEFGFYGFDSVFIVGSVEGLRLFQKLLFVLLEILHHEFLALVLATGRLEQVRAQTLDSPEILQIGRLVLDLAAFFPNGLLDLIEDVVHVHGHQGLVELFHLVFVVAHFFDFVKYVDVLHL